MPYRRLPKSILLLVLLLAPCSTTRAAEFHVSPAGNDRNPGTRQAPFASIAGALRAVRKARDARPEESVVVVLHAAVYRIDEPLEFTPDDGGSETASVTYRAAAGEPVTLSGGRPIQGWSVQDDGSWAADVGDLRFRQLWVNGRRAVRARHPNTGYFRVDEVGEDRRTHFRYREGDLEAYPDVGEIELVFLHDWSISRVPLQSIDPAMRTLTVRGQVGGPSRWAVMDWFEKQPRYYLENSPEFLDAPGEWYLDAGPGRVRYRPRAGETIEDAEVIAPVASQLIVVQGDVASGRPVRNLHFEGLRCCHTGWSPPGGVYWGRQACTYWTPSDRSGGGHHEADPAAVQFDLADGCSFRGGRVEHVGASAIWFGRTCTANQIADNIVADAGGNGIMIGEGQVRQVDGEPWWQAAPDEAAEDNTVAGNTVEHCGRELYGAVGVWMGLAARTTIARNEIRQVPYTGVSIGWMWWNPRDRSAPRPTPCRETRVVQNHIHHVMQTLSDGGGIYALGIQPDSLIRGNLIHDVPTNAGRAESNGMFLDQGTGEFLITGNTIYAVDRSPLRFHKGWENHVTENVLVVEPGVPPVRYNDTREERIQLQDNRILESLPEGWLERARAAAGPGARP